MPDTETASLRADIARLSTEVAALTADSQVLIGAMRISEYELNRLQAVFDSMNATGGIQIDKTSGIKFHSEPNYHRFKPTIASASSVDISAGSWTRNGITVTSSAASGIGTAANLYIIAALDDADTPTTLTVSAASTVPTANEQDTKRLICSLEFTSAVITKIYRHQLGDIQDQVQLIQAADDSWSDGGDEAGVSFDVVTAVQYSSPNLEFKRRTLTIVNGRIKIGKEIDWEPFATAEVCP